jgi:hypothetical protein
MSKRPSGKRRRIRARPLLIAAGVAVALGGCSTPNHGATAQCPPGEGNATPCPIAVPDLSASAPADLGSADLARRGD